MPHKFYSSMLDERYNNVYRIIIDVHEVTLDLMNNKSLYICFAIISYLMLESLWKFIN